MKKLLKSYTPLDIARMLAFVLMLLCLGSFVFLHSFNTEMAAIILAFVFAILFIILEIRSPDSEFITYPYYRPKAVDVALKLCMLVFSAFCMFYVIELLLKYLENL